MFYLFMVSFNFVYFWSVFLPIWHLGTEISHFLWPSSNTTNSKSPSLFTSCSYCFWMCNLCWFWISLHQSPKLWLFGFCPISSVCPLLASECPWWLLAKESAQQKCWHPFSCQLLWFCTHRKWRMSHCRECLFLCRFHRGWIIWTLSMNCLSKMRFLWIFYSH